MTVILRPPTRSCCCGGWRCGRCSRGRSRSLRRLGARLVRPRTGQQWVGVKPLGLDGPAEEGLWGLVVGGVERLQAVEDERNTELVEKRQGKRRHQFWWMTLCYCATDINIVLLLNNRMVCDDYIVCLRLEILQCKLWFASCCLFVHQKSLSQGCSAIKLHDLVTSCMNLEPNVKSCYCYSRLRNQYFVNCYRIPHARSLCCLCYCC